MYHDCISTTKQFVNLLTLIDTDEWHQIEFDIINASNLNKECFSTLILQKPDGSKVVLQMALMSSTV